MKRISEPSQLPEWFDIEPYLEWEDKNPVVSVESIEERFDFIHSFKKYSSLYRKHKNAISRTLDSLKDMAISPYLSTLYRVEDLLIDEDYIVDASVLHQCISDSIASFECGYTSYFYDSYAMRAVSLYDALQWIEENKAIMQKIEKEAKEISRATNWPVADVLREIQKRIPIPDNLGNTGYCLYPLPTYAAAMKEVSRHMEYISDGVELIDDDSGLEHQEYNGYSIKNSDVIKLFEYRVAAYADLKIWEELTESKITNKCMAKALFPDGRFTEWHFAKSKTIGAYLSRLTDEYLGALIHKAAEMETLRK